MSSSRRSSTSSDSFDSTSGRRSPIHGFDSSAALILVADPEESLDSDPTPFDFSSDDDEAHLLGSEDEQLERLRTSSIPPLSSSTVFLYLLTPLVKLGAILSVDESGSGAAALPVKWAIPALVFFAVLCALTRQIWYILARYVRKADMEEILLDTFARGRGKERQRRIIRAAVRMNMGIFRALLIVVYLRASVDVLLPLLPDRLLLPSRFVVTILLSLGLYPLCLARSLGSTSTLYTTWLSVATFAAWIACTAYAHARGILTVNPTGESLGILWQGISVIAFTYTTSSTLPLYASLKGTIQPGAPKPKRSQSFKLLSVMSVVVATILILPLTFFRSVSSPTPSSVAFKTFVAFLNCATLALTIPSVIIPLPTLPLPLVIRRATKFPVSKSIIYIICICLSLVPQSLSRILSDVLLVLAFLSTYILPAILHITIHNFRRPLAIVIPPSTPITPNPNTRPTIQPSESRNDELLQRKERTLQRRRFGKRIVWDIGVWVLLLPVGGGGLVWAAGRIMGRW